MSDLLTVVDLSIRTAEKELVKNVSFSLPEGARMGLIGESGSGKSLTALAATGLLPPAITASGSVIIGAQEIIGTPDQALNRMRGSDVAVVFQEPLTALDPLMKIGDQIGWPVRRRFRREGQTTNREAVRNEVLSLMEQVRLPEPKLMLNRYPHEISGGQRQRVAIAMAVACRPKLLIADEPTTALDVTTQAEVLKLLDGLVRDYGMSLLFISHDLPVVASIVDDVTVLRLGEVVEQGTTRQVFEAPSNPYSQGLMEAARTFDSYLQDI
ncbi:ABC transporter ATP-binding protein [Sulfitobacter sp. F26204]|uniref:ATP-binding cassette domain-containing protein n=1 Tax=Sulfitobacter sp. F26204 TaxID=2996014 RepID=UPI00225E4BF7|nr:ABC transporter ATP-binding protein [Sulfitobacter sp. F26204]MCX7560499.1 ABC transporter ATP-binding protein [Sulfitobacter sp. F26204]